MEQAKLNGKRTIIVGTRQSALALQQTSQVIAHLEIICEQFALPYQFELKKILTKGDQILDVTLSKIGGKGLFVKEIEQALLDGEIDLAVHSMKDMPALLPLGLTIGAVPERVDARDAVLTKNDCTLAELPHGAKIGTSSLRRSAQLQSFRPDFEIIPLRGNIDTRIRKLTEQGFDAIILAAAGLIRMGWEQQISEYLLPDICLPAVAQGALGLECRQTDETLLSLLSHYDHLATRLEIETERSFLATLDGGCQFPIAGHATYDPQTEQISLTGMVASIDGQQIFRYSESANDPLKLGQRVANHIIEMGASEVLRELRG